MKQILPPKSIPESGMVKKRTHKPNIKRGIKLLILSDLLIYFGIGLTSPILSIFIKDGLNSTLAMAGLAATFFLIIKSVSQLASSRIFNPEDRLKMVFIGTSMIILTQFVYAFSNNITMMFIAQAIYGLGAGLTSPAWMSLFILNVDKKTPGYEWSLYSTIVGIGMGTAAYIGGGLVGLWGFKTVFLISGVLGICGALILFNIAKEKMK